MNLSFSFLSLHLFEGELVSFLFKNCFSLGEGVANLFLFVNNIDSEFLNVFLGLCWLFLELHPILRFQVKHRLLRHRLVKHRLLRHKLVKHRLLGYKLVKHRLLRHKLVKHRLVRPATQTRTQ